MINGLERVSCPRPRAGKVPPKAAEGAPPAPHRRKGWTLARRARQAALCRLAQPWRRATGPRTGAGKARSSTNALKHGHRSRAHIETMRAQRQKRRQVRHILDVAARNLRLIRIWMRAREAGLEPGPLVGFESILLPVLRLPPSAPSSACRRELERARGPGHAHEMVQNRRKLREGRLAGRFRLPFLRP